VYFLHGIRRLLTKTLAMPARVDRALLAFWLAAAGAGLILYGPYHLDELGQIVAFSLRGLRHGVSQAPWPRHTRH